MRPLRLFDALAWCGGDLEGDPGTAFNSVTVDSRRAVPECLFVALRGPRFDGHEFVAAAAAAGASAAMVETDFPAPPGLDLPLLRADGTARALGALARGYRKTLEITACAVTGSNGKTTTKTLLGSLLGSVMPTAVAPASYNNLIGVSLSVLAVEGGDRAAVFELGMNRSGEIAALAAISLPEIGVITNIGAAHLGMLGSMEAVAA
nr:Mur ligase family protein [bacterium]